MGKSRGEIDMENRKGILAVDESSRRKNDRYKVDAGVTEKRQ